MAAARVLVLLCALLLAAAAPARARPLRGDDREARDALLVAVVVLERDAGHPRGILPSVLPPVEPPPVAPVPERDIPGIYDMIDATW
jgi:hypothetical protein